ncbi:rod shape-determining protein MreC [Lentisalinibacter salinarum]|uniref:rod shape-determining protein MreC n=1 Tax=Lentisalinibacter salinarum TaxID=2992239 RepID=UPI003864AD88
MRSLGARTLALVLLSVIALVVDHRENHLDAVRRAIATAIYPLQVIVALPAEALGWARESGTSRSDLQRENNRLKAERLAIRAKLQQMAALESENARLRLMLQTTTRVGDRVRVAEIMAVDANPYRHDIVIDKGRRHGAYEGQAIIDATGVVGQIMHTGPFTSEAMLISDPDHALPVEVNRNGLRTIAVGTGEYDRLDLPFLPNNADIRPGDLLVTSGLGGAFPAGYPVGEVSEVTPNPAESFATIRARPATALNQVREVLLIWPSEPEAQAADESGEDAAGITEPADETASGTGTAHE